MGHGHSKEKAEFERIMREVKDVQTYIKDNTDDFDDECRDNIHKRLIDYSTALQVIFDSPKKKRSKEFSDGNKTIVKVIEDLYQLRAEPLDSGAVESNSFIHVPAKDSKKRVSLENLAKENFKRQPKQKRDLPPSDKFKLPSLEEIKNKTISLKPEIENSIRNDDMNQLLVQQKLVQILATDLEMLNFEAYSPLQEIKEALEKDLSLFYRKIEKAKKRSSDLAYLKQQREIREGIGELTRINTRVDQILSLAHTLVKEKKFLELINFRDEVLNCRKKVGLITNTNQDVLKLKNESEQKIDKLLNYLNLEINAQEEETSTNSVGDILHKIDDLVSERVSEIESVNSNVDQIMCRAHRLVKENKFAELFELKSRIIQNKATLEKVRSGDKTMDETIVDVEQKIDNILDYLDKQIDSSGIGRKIMKTDENLNKADELIKECRDGINNFDKSTQPSTYQTYMKHLDGLENFLSKVTVEEMNIMNKKAMCLQSLSECRRQLERNVDKYIRSTATTDNENQLLTDDSASNIFSYNDVDIKQALGENFVKSEDNVILRKAEKTSKSNINEIRTIDGFYSYWKDLQSNLPSFNCTYEELQQISLLLRDIEKQIHAKRTNIESFLDSKQQSKPLKDIKEVDDNADNKLETNRRIIDQIDGYPVKANAKIYNIGETKKLVIDDEEILQNVDEINKHLKRIEKLTPEKVFVQSDSVSDSTQDEENGIIQQQKDHQNLEHDITSPRRNIESIQMNETKKQQTKMDSEKRVRQNNQHIEYLTQVQNILRDVNYLKERATEFSGKKQTPKYFDIKNKLDSYRRTLNILISYQNESITLSCNRVLETIDEVIEILNKNTEKHDLDILKSAKKRNTIENLFTDLMDIKSLMDEVGKRINNFEDHIESDEYISIQNSLLESKEAVQKIIVNPNYELVANAKSDILKQIDEYVYNLTIKLEENKIRKRHNLINSDDRKQKIITDFQKVKDKINRFSGTYKNVLYKEIEKSTERFIETAKTLTDDSEFQRLLNDDAAKYLKILEEKSIKGYNNTDTIRIGTEDTASVTVDTEKCSSDVALQLSRIRQNLKDIKETIESLVPLTLEANRDLDHRINLNILELSSINISLNEPFYYDKENLREEFLALSSLIKENIVALEGDRTEADGQCNSTPTTMRVDKNNSEEELSNIEENVRSIKSQIDVFSNERSSIDFFNIDEALTRMSMNVDKILTNKGTDLHKKKLRLLKSIYEFCEILECKAQDYEILQNIEKKMREVKYRLDNFHDLSDGDYNALHKELVDLDVTLKELNVSDNIVDKKSVCQDNIQQCLSIIEDKIKDQSDGEYGSDEGTFV